MGECKSNKQNQEVSKLICMRCEHCCDEHLNKNCICNFKCSFLVLDEIVLLPVFTGVYVHTDFCCAVPCITTTNTSLEITARFRNE